MHKCRCDKKGFTLIELLIVIAVIGILSVVFLPQLLESPAKARDAKRIKDVDKIGGFLTAEYAETGTLPVFWSYFDPAEDSSVSGLINDNLAGFGGVFPIDPDNKICTWGDGGDCEDDTGLYIYVHHPSFIPLEDSTYLFAVIANVEDETNGNAANWGDYTLEESGPLYIYLGQE